ncbi:hypothetical protein [Polaribacter ponticola]|uniref:Uncharacterized protein n=1 Tax=Polaribacter ponticola TaxID=2978475 RepID=A0ABT5SA85_9FLAO|nr:hypothetical protein [Polaribacter sp. MSW5]MDD7915027.1 hypothetical protein [Polaribacter sp. MSW5]
MLSFCITQLSSQNNSIDTFEAKVGEYFNLDYETFYTHVNKTTFFKNEEIWFKTYVYNTKTQLPYMSATNIYTSLYNEDGKLITKKYTLLAKV